MITRMKCPICRDPVDDVTDPHHETVSEGAVLMVTEHWDHEQETYEDELHIYKCHSDHTFYMNPGEMTICPTC